MPTVSFSYTITASTVSPVVNFGYAIRVPANTARQILKRQHYAIPGSIGSAEKRDPLGNSILTGVYPGRSARLTCTVSGKAWVDPEQGEEDWEEQTKVYSEATERTRVGGLLRVVYLHHSADGDDVQRALHFCEMLRDDFACRTRLKSHHTAEEAMESRTGSPEDLAHIILALCRLDHITARFVTGLGPHGPAVWIEIWSGGRWAPIDPRACTLCDHQYLKIAHGRDGDDVTLAALSGGCNVSCVEIHGSMGIDHSSTH